MQGKRRHSELLTPKINISAESLFKVLIFQQQKTINELIAKVSKTWGPQMKISLTTKNLQKQ